MPHAVLSRLESALLKTVEELRGLRAENADLKEAIKKLNDDLEELKRENRGREDTIREHRRERIRIRSYVEKVIKNLSVLEEDID